MAIRKPSEYFDREKASVENVIQGSIENPELNSFSDAYDAFKRNLSKVDVLTDFSETLGNYQSNIEKVNHLSEKIDEIDGDIKNLLTKEDLDKALVSQLLFLEECIRDVQEKVKGINQKNLTQVKLDVSSLSETVNTFIDDELPRYEKLVSDSEIRLTNRCEVLEEELKETLDNIKDVVDEKYVEYFSSLNEELDRIKKNGIPRYEKLVSDSEIRLTNRCEVLEEELKETLDNIKDVVDEKYVKDFSSLNEELDRIKKNDIPRYKTLIIDSEIKTDSKIKEFAEFLDNTVSEIRLTNRCEVLEEELKETLDNIKDVVDEKYVKDFSSLNEELDRIKKNDIPRYKTLIIDSEIKTDSKIKEFAEFLDNTVNDVVSKIELVKEDNTEIFDTLNSKVSEVNRIHDLMLEDIEKSETTRDELDKKVVDLKIEILRNESHIENQNKSIETIHEDVKSAIDKLNIEEIQKNNSRLASKVKYIEEVFEKFNEKEILNESIITEPSSSDNSDPLTPLDQKFVTLDQLQSHYRLFVNRIQQQLSSLGGGGETKLKYLDDIVGIATNASVYDGKFLKYDHSIEKFEFVTVSGGIGTTVSVNTSGIITASSFSGSGANLTNISNTSLDNTSVSFGGVSLDLGQSDATPAFDLSDATNYPTSSLSGSITNDQLAGSIANDKLVNDSVSFGGVSLDLGASDATPAFDLSDATNYPYASLTGITTSIEGDATPKLGGNLNLNSNNITGNGNVDITGVVTATSFVGNLTGTASTATSLSNSRTFQLTGDIIASPISFDGTGNVSLAATIQPNSVSLSDDTTGDYVSSISGTGNQITVTAGTGEGSTPTISISDNSTLPGTTVTIATDLQVNRNLNVNGNVTIGGTSATIFTETLKISDPDIIVGFRTDAGGNDISNDTTANHGGIGLASTEGSPLVSLINGSESLPDTYKKIMWFKSGSFTGLATDAWLTNYAFGVGTTTMSAGTKFAVGNIETDFDDITSVVNINSSGVITATTFSGNLPTTDLTGTITNAQLAGSIANDKLVNSSVSYGGIELSLGGTDATPAFDLSDATNYPYTSLTGITTEILGDTTPQLGGNLDINGKFITGTGGVNVTGVITATEFSGSGASLTNISNTALTNNSVNYGGVTVSLGGTNATPAFDLSAATAYPYTSLTGITTEIVGDTTPQLGGNLDLNSNNVTGTGNFNVTGIVTATSFSGSGANLTGLTGASAATYGDASNVAQIVVDANGRITSISEVTISGGGGDGSPGGSDGQIQYNNGGAFGGATQLFYDDSNNRVGINSATPTESLDVIGSVKATDFNTTSDKNLKDNIKTIENPLSKVLSIRGVNFEWKDSNKASAGVIAQEVEKVLPELVTGQNTKTVNYNGLIGLLIETVKEQQKQIDTLNEKISKLE